MTAHTQFPSQFLHLHIVLFSCAQLGLCLSNKTRVVGKYALLLNTSLYHQKLLKLFKRVVVPTEMPSKSDYGDVDFLVSGFLNTAPDAALDWPATVAGIKDALQTVHGRRGFLTPENMYFAVQAPVPEDDQYWVQIDLKVLEATNQNSFEWELFELYYASGLKMMASLMKPLGITIDPEGLHIRVEEMEATNHPGSLVFVSKEPTDVLKILGLDKRFLYGGFSSKEDCKWLARADVLPN